MRAPLIAVIAVLSLAACNKPAATPAASSAPATDTASTMTNTTSEVPEALLAARKQTAAACKTDRETLCPGLKGRDLGACFRDHKDKLSQVCKDARANQRQVRQQMQGSAPAPDANAAASNPSETE